MKRIALIGATGFIGSAILQEALKGDHEVVALVRNPEKISILQQNLIIKKGDVSSIETVVETCQGADAVISAYNPGWSNPMIFEDTLRVYPVILEGVKQAGVKKSYPRRKNLTGCSSLRQES